jgi:arylsulfatase A-like enzyme
LFDYMSIDKDPMTRRDIALARDCYDDCIAFLDDQLGRLVDQLRARRLLENTVVIITSDHGEGFGDHKRYGHASGLHLDEIGVPLVILAPGAPAGRVVDDPVSLRDLPATVVDELGLAAGSPFPGQSLAARWQSQPGEPARGTATPALSDLATSAAFSPPPTSGARKSGFELSLVAADHHYLRDGTGVERLYDLRNDRFEQANLIGSARGGRTVAVFRQRLFDVLTANPATIEVETGYLKSFRQELEAQIHEAPPPARK